MSILIASTQIKTLTKNELVGELSNLWFLCSLFSVGSFVPPLEKEDLIAG